MGPVVCQTICRFYKFKEEGAETDSGSVRIPQRLEAVVVGPPVGADLWDLVLGTAMLGSVNFSIDS